MTYSNLNLLGQPEAILAVGSGDLLGGWSLLILGIINITVFVWSIVDMAKIHRDSIKNIERENEGERNKPSRISLQNQSRFKLLVGNLQKLIKAFFNARYICRTIFCHKNKRGVKPPNEKS
jgi:hypothetical protein